jgi:hypothetical protein
MFIMTDRGWQHLGGDAWAGSNDRFKEKSIQEQREADYEARRQFHREMRSDIEADYNA